MAFEIENFKELGGPGNSVKGGQLYSIFSETDAMGDMLQFGYLNLLADILNKRDFIFFSAVDGSVLAQVVSNISGDVDVVDFISDSDEVEGNGPITADLQTDLTKLKVNSAITDLVYNLPSGTVIGQRKMIILIASTGADAVVTPGLFADPSKSRITLDTVKEFVELIWTGTFGWKVVVTNGSVDA